MEAKKDVEAAVAEERSGFLGRWARRKSEALQGKALDEPVTVAKPAAKPAPVAVAASAQTAAPAPALAVAPEPRADAAPPPEKALSLEDVKALTQSSDFKPFMAQGVGPQVRNAAMKKLFADPHYNVMDGLDIYIDDYSIADPLPQAMLRQMASAKFLNLFDDEDHEKGEAGGKDKKASQNTSSDPALPSAAAQADPAPAPADLYRQPEPEPMTRSGASQDNHAHSHLRLQPDHAAPAPNAGRGAS